MRALLATLAALATLYVCQIIESTDCPTGAGNERCRAINAGALD